MNAKYIKICSQSQNEPIKAICGKLDAVPKTKPIFSRPNMRYQIKNAEMETKNLPKKTKRTHLWITFCAG
jgi:hypothetical protein